MGCQILGIYLNSDYYYDFISALIGQIEYRKEYPEFTEYIKLLPNTSVILRVIEILYNDDYLTRREILKVFMNNLTYFVTEYEDKQGFLMLNDHFTDIFPYKYTVEDALNVLKYFNERLKTED